MTTFITADIPSELTTIEQLNVWTGAILAFNNPTSQYVEAPNTNPLFRCFQPTTRIPSFEKMVINRMALELDETLESQGKPIWVCPKIVTDTNIPDAFKANYLT